MFDHDIQEFPSPLRCPSTDLSPLKPPKPVVVSIPGLHQNQALAIAFEALGKMPVPRQNLLLSHLMALLQMHPADCAIVALHVQPYLSDAQIAALCGKCERQLRRYPEYRKFKADLAAAKEHRREELVMPIEIED